MGLTKPSIRFLAREHARKPFAGPVLILGRQNVYATLEEARAILKSEGVAAAELPRGLATTTNIPAWRDTPYAKNTSDVAVFELLGASEVLALDYTALEGADVVHDLNLPVPKELHERFDLLLDPGTIEHVFDVRQVMMNIARMVRPGGRVIHMSPSSNHVNHGFYQFSPTFFYDYYSTNGFVGTKGFLVESDIHVNDERWEIFEVGVEGHFASAKALITLFVAEKTPASTVDRVPVQSHYVLMNAGSGPTLEEASPRRPLRRVLKKTVPPRLRASLHPYYGLFERYVPWLDPQRKPWGLKRWDVF